MFEHFTDDQIERYSHQIILPEVGGKGQLKLLNSKVLVVGAGGIGSPVIREIKPENYSIEPNVC